MSASSAVSSTAGGIAAGGPAASGPASSGLAGSLASQLDSAAAIMLANNWVTKPQLDHIRMRVINAKDPVPSAGRSLLAQFLLDNRLLPRDQIGDLDALVRTQLTLPEFQLTKKIGAGGMGTVFLAIHKASQRQVALKTMNARLADDKDFIERFHREARALEKVRNEHIAEIIACGETEGTCWLAMEYIEGPSLMSLLKEHRVLPEHYALNLTRQIAEGLGHVWTTARLIHRDIKPENVLVIRHRLGDELFPCTDIAKLIDFGLVKSNNEDDRLTQTGMTIGTPLYMSPEQVRGESLDCRSDIYGVGATLYHLLTGHTPFSGSSPGAIMSAHLTETVPDPGDRVPSLSKLTRQLVMTAMAKNTEKRYTTFEALIAACNEALSAIDHKSGSMPRLLRKPMVLKNPVKRSGEFTADGHDINAPPAPLGDRSPAPHASTAKAQRSSTERTVNPKTTSALKPTGSNAPTVVTSTQKLPSDKIPTTNFLIPKPSVRPGLPASSNRIAIVPHAIKSKPSAATSSSEIQPPATSSAFIEHPPSPGMGLLPWLVLGFAMLALGSFLAITYI